MLRFDDRVWFLWAAWILLLPLNWLLAASFAAVAHEACHVAAVIVVGGKVRGITVAPFGSIIETEGIDGLRELICALAGPLGSFGLALSICRFPVLGLCALIHGLFNLLPVYPLDGGRVLLRFLEYILPKNAEMTFQWVERTALILLLCLIVVVSQRYSFGILSIFFCVFVIIKALLRKKP